MRRKLTLLGAIMVAVALGAGVSGVAHASPAKNEFVDKWEAAGPQGFGDKWEAVTPQGFGDKWE